MNNKKTLKKEILLVIPNTSYSKIYHYEYYRHTPLESITRISNLLEQYEYDVEIIDCREFKYSIKELVEFAKEYKFIGITTFFDSYSFIEDFSKAVTKKNKDSIIIIGGPLASSIPELFVDYTNIDFVIKGKGDIVLLNLLEYFYQNIFKKNNIKDRIFSIHNISEIARFNNIENYPLLNWDIYKDLKKKNFDYMYIASLGCQNKCSYCSNPNTSFKLTSVNNFEKELKYLINKWNLEVVLFNDSDFFQHPLFDSYLDILKDLKIKWGGFTRPEKLNKIKLRKAIESGCINIRFGLESFDNEVLKSNFRNVNIADMNNALEMCFDSAIQKVTGSFVIGLYGETKSSIKKTINNIEKYPKLIPRAFSLIPLPGTHIFNLALKKNLISNEIKLIRDLKNCRLELDDPIFINFTSMTNEELISVRQDIIGIMNEREKGVLNKCLIKV